MKKRSPRLFLLAILVVSMTNINTPAQSEVEMEDDAEKLNSIYKQVNGIPDFRIREGLSEKIGENYAHFQKALDGINKTSLMKDAHGAFVSSIAKKYVPSESEDYIIVRKLNNKFEPLSLGYDVGDQYEAIVFRFGLLKTAGPKNALLALEQIKRSGTDPVFLKTLHEIYRVKSIEEAKSLMAIAPMFDPGNERITRRVERLRGQVDEAFASYKAEEMRVLKSRKWKPNIGSTSAGSPGSLSSAGQKFMAGLPDWGGNTKRQTVIKKVSIIGDWFVAERDASGRPTRYGLPAAVAVTDNTMDEGVVTVYEVSLITADPVKNTRWYGVWVGKVWRMLGANLPK